MAVLELHSLRALPPSLLNRDDQGLPKEADFGGFQRARFSSQTIKHAMRLYFGASGLVPEENLSDRTRTLYTLLTERLVALGRDQQDAETLAVNVIWGMGLLGTDPKNAVKRYTNVLLFISSQEIQGIALAIDDEADALLAEALPPAQIWPELDADPDAEPVKAASKKERKAACPKGIQAFAKPLLTRLDSNHAVDIALFGRFLAEEPGARVDGAACVAHGLGVTELNVTLDYYTSVDDLLKESGFLATTHLVAPTIYQYGAVDLRQLNQSLDGDEKLVELALRAFTTAFIEAMPTGKRTSTAPFTKPDLVVAVLRADQPLSLVNSFRKPIAPRTGTDLMDSAVSALTKHWKNIGESYGHEGVIGAWHLHTGDPGDLADPLPGDKVTAAELATRSAGRAVLHLAG
jgi:CRISPR system Cascade subunit CasC